MTATATRKGKTGALDELQNLEEAWGEAQSVTRELSRKHHSKQTDLRGLLDQQNRRLHRVPGEFLPDGTPLPDTEAATTQAAIGALGRCDFTPEIQHAERLERVAREAFGGFAGEHAAEINEARRADGEALVATYRERAEALADAAEAVLVFAQRSIQFAAMQRIDTHRVPGLDEAGHAVRATRTMAETGLPLPLMELDR